MSIMSQRFSVMPFHAAHDLLVLYTALKVTVFFLILALKDEQIATKFDNKLTDCEKLFE